MQKSLIYRTPLKFAYKSGQDDVVKLVLNQSDSKNIDWNVRDMNGGTSFMFACKLGHKDVVKLENKLVELRLF